MHDPSPTNRCYMQMRYILHPLDHPLDLNLCTAATQPFALLLAPIPTLKRSHMHEGQCKQEFDEQCGSTLALTDPTGAAAGEHGHGLLLIRVTIQVVLEPVQQLMALLHDGQVSAEQGVCRGSGATRRDVVAVCCGCCIVVVVTYACPARCLASHVALCTSRLCTGGDG